MATNKIHAVIHRSETGKLALVKLTNDLDEAIDCYRTSKKKGGTLHLCARIPTYRSRPASGEPKVFNVAHEEDVTQQPKEPDKEQAPPDELDDFAASDGKRD